MANEPSNYTWHADHGQFTLLLGNITDVLARDRVMNHELDTEVARAIEAANQRQFQTFLPPFVLICILLLIGLPGNVVALIIYHKKVKKAIAKNFLITMCVCDTLTCAIVMPMELDIMRHFFEYDQQWLCKSFRFFAYAVNNVSSLTLVAIAVERYRIICNPWKPKFDEKLSKRICLFNVLLSILCSVPMAFIYGTQTIPLGTVLVGDNTINETVAANCSGISKQCNISNSDHVTPLQQQTTRELVGKSCLMDANTIQSRFPMYVVCSYIASIIIVFMIFTYLYSQVIHALAQRRNKSMSQRKSALQGSAGKRVKRVTLMSIILTLAYEICYLPCLTAVCIRLAHPGIYMTLSTAGKSLFEIMLKSYLLNSAVNPFIYCFCNSEFRAGLFKMVKTVQIPFIPKRQDSVGDSENSKSLSETPFAKVI